MSPSPRLSFGLRGSTALLAAIAVVVVLLITLPAYRVFFLISVAIGVVIVAVLRLWYRFHPVKEAKLENKRPLGL
jgi:hypothetical protein